MNTAGSVGALTVGPRGLPRREGWPESVHDFLEHEILAINAAISAKRPLLVIGEPGTGKTQLARAAAEGLSRHFLSHTVDAHTEAQDLFWTVDSVRRLAEAQVIAAKVSSLRLPGTEKLDIQDESSFRRSMEMHPVYQIVTEYMKEELAEIRFVRPGVLWKAFQWEKAAEHAWRNGETSFKSAPLSPQDSLDTKEAKPTSMKHGTVVLIDEIDKADPILPNALLEALGTGRFRGPPGGQEIHKDGPEPLVIMTSNRERELPYAFMRRCFVLELKLPDGDELVDLLIARGRQHAEVWQRTEAVPEPSIDVLKEAAERVVNERKKGKRGRKVGQAEYLDLLRAVCGLSTKDTERLKLLKRLESFTLRKYSAY